MAETQKAAAKTEAKAEAAAETEEATLERKTGQDFEVGSEEVVDPRVEAAFAERQESVEKLVAENAARVQ